MRTPAGPPGGQPDGQFKYGGQQNKPDFFVLKPRNLGSNVNPNFGQTYPKMYQSKNE